MKKCFIIKNRITKGVKEIVCKKEDISQVNRQLSEWLEIINDKSSINSISGVLEKVNTKNTYSLTPLMFLGKTKRELTRVSESEITQPPATSETMRDSRSLNISISNNPEKVNTKNKYSLNPRRIRRNTSLLRANIFRKRRAWRMIQKGDVIKGVKMTTQYQKGMSVMNYLKELGLNMLTIMEAVDDRNLEKSYQLISEDPQILKEEFLETMGIEEESD